jgi:hypothetical protein
MQERIVTLQPSPSLLKKTLQDLKNKIFVIRASKNGKKP